MKIYRLYEKLVRPFSKRIEVKIVNMAPNQLLKGRTALITGTTSGIGYAIAVAYLRAGANVIATGRDSGKLEKAVRELKTIDNRQGEVFSMILDVIKVGEFKERIKEAISLSPNHRIDILVNNAGVGPIKCTSQEEKYDTIMNTNLRSVYFLSGIIARHMIDNGIEGNILNIASSSSLRPASSIYGISKWGIRGVTEGLARLLIPHGIVVNGVGPGPTATPFMGKQAGDDLSNPRNPSGRYATPEEVANIAVVLTSGMGRMIVGDIIYLSGGAGVVTFDDIDYNFK